MQLGAEGSLGQSLLPRQSPVRRSASPNGDDERAPRLRSPARDFDNLGFDSPLVQMTRSSSKLFDALGGEEVREVTIDELKGRFFVIGLQTGFTLNLFLMSILLMSTTYNDRTGAIHELSNVYYPLFRCLFLFCFFFCCHGVDLFVWKRYGIDYRAILGVSHSHNYHSVIRVAFGMMCLVFTCFALYVLTLNNRLTPNKHVWPAVALVGSALIFLWPSDLMPEWSDRAQRYKLLQRLGKVMVSPLSRVTFAHSTLSRRGSNTPVRPHTSAHAQPVL